MAPPHPRLTCECCTLARHARSTWRCLAPAQWWRAPRVLRPASTPAFQHTRACEHAVIAGRHEALLDPSSQVIARATMASSLAALTPPHPHTRHQDCLALVGRRLTLALASRHMTRTARSILSLASTCMCGFQHLMAKLQSSPLAATTPSRTACGPAECATVRAGCCWRSPAPLLPPSRRQTAWTAASGASAGLPDGRAAPGKRYQSQRRPPARIGTAGAKTSSIGRVCMSGQPAQPGVALCDVRHETPCVQHSPLSAAAAQ